MTKSPSLLLAFLGSYVYELQFCQQPDRLLQAMFLRFARPLWKSFFTPKKILIASSILTYSLFRTQKTLLDSVVVQQQTSEEVMEHTSVDLDQYIKKLQTVEVCQGKELTEGERKVVTVKDYEGKERKIMVMRLAGRLYSFLASCPHKEPFDGQQVQIGLEDAACFNDKLYCPYHGCVFDIKSGSVEHGPSLLNLPIFFAEEREGKVYLTYPSAIPASVAPSMLERDGEDLRKVVILGGDDAATIGCVTGLRQFGFQGQISVVKEGKFHYPYRRQYLHKSLLNMHLSKEENANPSIEEKIQATLQEKIYSKLNYFRKEWYQYYGIDFIFNEESYRIINKQYYPYITFGDGTRMEFDGLLVATGVVQKVPAFESITVNSDKDNKIRLAENVFCPLRSKEQHQKLVSFLNRNPVRHLLVLGYNMESLQFIDALHREFPEVKVTVVDNQKDSAVAEIFGPDIEKALAKEFTSRGVEFYIKVQEDLIFSNRYSYKKAKAAKLRTTQTKQVAKPVVPDYKDSVQVRLSDELRVKADGVVIFPQSFSGNTQWVKNGKYTDFDYFHDERLSGDTFGRTDNIRIFAAGSGSANEYFLLNKRLVSNNPLVAQEQGFNVALNMEALRVPFSYVPYQAYSFFGKRLLYVGTKEFFDSVLIIGSVEKWDFVAIYALGSKVKGVSASQSRSKQLSILREAFRVNCVPMFEDLVSGYWTIENLERLIRQLRKSGCYRDLLFQNRQNIHKKDLIWMQRSPDAGFQNDRPVLSEEYPSVQVADNGVLKQL